MMPLRVAPSQGETAKHRGGAMKKDIELRARLIHWGAIAFFLFTIAWYLLQFFGDSPFEQSYVSELPGVSLRMEQAIFPQGTAEIAVTWVNDTRYLVMFGERFYLERRVDGGWESVPFQEDTYVLLIAHSLDPAGITERVHVYNLGFPLVETPLKRGIYRIVAEFGASDRRLPATWRNYSISIDFKIE